MQVKASKSLRYALRHGVGHLLMVQRKDDARKRLHHLNFLASLCSQSEGSQLAYRYAAFTEASALRDFMLKEATAWAARANSMEGVHAIRALRDFARDAGWNDVFSLLSKSVVDETVRLRGEAFRGDRTSKINALLRTGRFDEAFEEYQPVIDPERPWKSRLRDRFNEVTLALVKAPSLFNSADVFHKVAMLEQTLHEVESPAPDALIYFYECKAKALMLKSMFQQERWRSLRASIEKKGGHTDPPCDRSECAREAENALLQALVQADAVDGYPNSERARLLNDLANIQADLSAMVPPGYTRRDAESRTANSFLAAQLIYAADFGDSHPESLKCWSAALSYAPSQMSLPLTRALTALNRGSDASAKTKASLAVALAYRFALVGDESQALQAADYALRAGLSEVDAALLCRWLKSLPAMNKATEPVVRELCTRLQNVSTTAAPLVWQVVWQWLRTTDREQLTTMLLQSLSLCKAPGAAPRRASMLFAGLQEDDAAASIHFPAVRKHSSLRNLHAIHDALADKELPLTRTQVANAIIEQTAALLAHKQTSSSQVHRNNLGWLLLDHGDPTEAREHFRILRQHWQEPDKWETQWARLGEALCDARLGASLEPAREACQKLEDLLGANHERVEKARIRVERACELEGKTR